MFRFALVVIILFSISAETGGEKIEIELSSSSRNQRQLYQVYKTTKYTIPKRKIVISSGQVFRPDFVPNVRNTEKLATSENHQGLKKFHHGKVIFPDEYEKIKKQPKLQQRKEKLSQNLKAELGSLCQRSFDNKSGYCLFAHQCLHVVRDYRVHRLKIDICSYQNNLPVICCPLEQKDEIGEKDGQRISAKKCAEYNNFNSEMLKISRKANHAIKKCEASIPLIVGGEKTRPGEYPHMAAIGWIKITGRISWACGGTLISDRFILTAGHCSNLGGKTPKLVRLGDHDINSAKDDDTAQEFSIQNIFVHPKYNKDEYYYDIAVMQLSKPVEFSKSIRPACLWYRSNMDDVEIVTATGWGRTEYLGAKSDKLLKVDLNIIPNDDCNKLYTKEIRLPKGITERQFCAGYLEGGKDTCQGDSGGPIHTQMAKYNCINFVVGITSFGKVCAAPNAPGVYTKISAHLDWIEEIVFK